MTKLNYFLKCVSVKIFELNNCLHTVLVPLCSITVFWHLFSFLSDKVMILTGLSP